MTTRPNEAVEVMRPAEGDLLDCTLRIIRVFQHEGVVVAARALDDIIRRAQLDALAQAEELCHQRAEDWLEPGDPESPYTPYRRFYADEADSCAIAINALFTARGKKKP